MARVRDHIETHLSSVISNPSLARLAGLGVEGFVRSFRRHFGTTPAQYIREVRIRESSHLLLQTDETIDATAEKTGFPNRAYFSRVFKAITGKSPAAFRRAHSR